MFVGQGVSATVFAALVTVSTDDTTILVLCKVGFGKPILNSLSTPVFFGVGLIEL